MISIIIPSRDDDIETFKKTLDSINNQKLKPNELIIVDSSSNEKIKELIEQTFYDLIDIRFIKVDPSYAGKSMNLGIEQAKGDFIGFLDTKTTPIAEWLEKYISILKKNQCEVIFGNTKFYGQSSFQKIIKDCSYGNLGHESVPGTVAKKEIFDLGNFRFLENVRSGYDIEWRNKIKNNFEWHFPPKSYINYKSLPNNLTAITKKYFEYSFASALINIQSNQKELYFSIFLILSLLIVPRWNYLIGGWDQNPLYIPDIAKKYLLALTILFILIGSLRRFFGVHSKSFSFQMIKIILFFGSFYLIYSWNRLFAGWIEEAILYVPHITKIFIALILIGSFVYRGVVVPKHNGVDSKDIFPVRFFKLGAMGIYLDIIKFPGYVIGGFLQLFRAIASIWGK